MSNIHEKLNTIQTTLVAKKGQYNSFSKFNYRSVEDILESVKPFLKESKLTLNITDDIKLVGDRFYIIATVTLTDGKDSISTTGLAREPQVQKGMNESQITGSASSYARKYALNGLFAIDDVKDMDTIEERTVETKKLEGKIISDEQRTLIANLVQDTNTDLVKFNQTFMIKNLAELPQREFNKAVALLKSKQNKQKKEKQDENSSKDN